MDDDFLGNTWPLRNPPSGFVLSRSFVLFSRQSGAVSDTMRLTSTLTCPNCGHRALESMPTDACQFFYACKGCGAMLKPLPGDCCVFCSYGDVPCPPVQEARLAGGKPDCCGKS